MTKLNKFDKRIIQHEERKGQDADHEVRSARLYYMQQYNKRRLILSPKKALAILCKMKGIEQ